MICSSTMLRSLVFKRTLFKQYTNTPRSSYVVNKTYPQLIWNNLIPQPLKITTVIGAGILTFINYHPKYYVTIGPPLGLLGYFGYVKYRKYQYDQAVKRLGITKWEKSEMIRIAKYDESCIENVLVGIDNLYDSIRRQTIQLVEQRIIEYIFQNGSNRDNIDNEILSKGFVLENDQFNINIPEQEIESWITTNVKLEGSDELLRFIKFSVPYYDSKTVETRKRLGVVLVYLLEIPSENVDKTDFTDYKIGIEITPLSWFRPKSVYISEIPGTTEIMKSDIYNK